MPAGGRYKCRERVLLVPYWAVPSITAAIPSGAKSIPRFFCETWGITAHEAQCGLRGASPGQCGRRVFGAFIHASLFGSTHPLAKPS